MTRSETGLQQMIIIDHQLTNNDALKKLRYNRQVRDQVVLRTDIGCIEACFLDDRCNEHRYVSRRKVADSQRAIEQFDDMAQPSGRWSYQLF
jgi:hypothetical protein